MKVKIKKMPDKETLEAYIGQEEVSVIFNTWPTRGACSTVSG